MRDVLIATTVLAAGAYAAWSYEPGSAEASSSPAPASIAASESASEAVPAMPRTVALPLVNPTRITPLPMVRPGGDKAITLAVESREPSRSIEVLHAGLVEIDGERHALYGIDAPSLGQTCRNASSGLWACGTDARKAVARFLEGQSVSCQAVLASAEGPTASRCEVDGVDLAGWVVENGWAVVDSSVDTSLETVQATARGAQKGLWAGWFETPSEWRSRNDDDVMVAARGDRV